MALIGLSLASEREYQSRYDDARGTEDATKFQLGSLDSRIYGRIKDMATSMQVDPSRPDEEIKTNINHNDVAFEVVAYGLRSWTNFKDNEGNDIPFKSVFKRHGGTTYKAVDPDVLKLLPQAIVFELSQEIMRSNEVSVAEVKN